MEDGENLKFSAISINISTAFFLRQTGKLNLSQRSCQVYTFYWPVFPHSCSQKEKGKCFFLFPL